MEILRTISLYAEGKNMQFMLIGGHALNAHGISRQTGDIDLLVPLSSKHLWTELFDKLHYKKNQDSDKFARFNPDTIAAWPIDLMFVDDLTFEKMLGQSIMATLGSASVKIVSARHLATLKIHALKHFQEHRFAKDYNDLLNLLQSGKTEITHEELAELCKKYADPGLFDKLKSEWIKK